MCTTLYLKCISNHAFLVRFKYKCLFMPYNKRFINLACSVCTENDRTLVFFTNLALRARSVQKKTLVWYFSVQNSCSVNQKLVKSKNYQNLKPWTIIYKHTLYFTNINRVNMSCRQLNSSHAAMAALLQRRKSF
jgi:hypothetical protein